MTNSTKTRILYIGMVPPEVGGQEAGGVATHAWQLAIQARKRGDEVYMLANTISSFNKNGVNVIASPQRNKLSKIFHAIKIWPFIDKSKFNDINFLSFKKKISVLYGACLLQKILNSVKPDLIHIHSLHNIQSLTLRLLQNSIPLVITDHGFWQGFRNSSKYKYEYILKKVQTTANLADCIICVSKFSKIQMDKNEIGQTKKRVVINNPIFPEGLPLINKQKARDEMGLPENKKILFFNGVSEPVQRKRLDLILKGILANDWLRANCKLVCITNNEGLKYTEVFTGKIDILVLPPQPWEKIVKFYNAADVFVMPSKSESLGIVYEESLLAGIPIIGFYQIVNELEHLLGIYIGEKFDAWSEDEKVLAEKIIKVLNTEFDRELLRKKVIENLSWDAKFGEFDSVYKELLSK